MLRRFLIVEDHPLYADALQGVICNGIANVRTTHVGTLREGADAIRRVKRFDLVLLDLCLPDTHGFEGLIELRGLAPRLPIVVVSAFADQSVVHKSLVCGASGFIPKTADKDTLLQALTDILAGHVTPPGGGSLQPDAITKTELPALPSRLRSLTHQQLRVLQMLCQGMLNKQIAYELDVGETTVKAHITEIFRKLSVCCRTQAVAEVSKLNLDAMLALYAGDDGTGMLHCSRPTS
jgi:DNA-binding NarL/FixJ family response regulator